MTGEPGQRIDPDLLWIDPIPSGRQAAEMPGMFLPHAVAAVEQDPAFATPLVAAERSEAALCFFAIFVVEGLSILRRNEEPE